MDKNTMDQIANNCLTIFLQYKRWWVQTKIQITEMRKVYIVFGVICDFIECLWNILKWMFICTSYSAVEPNDPAWISLCKYYPSTLIGTEKDYGFDIAVKDFVPYNMMISWSDGLYLAYPERAQINNTYIRFTDYYLKYWTENILPTTTNTINCIEHPYWKFYKCEYVDTCKPYIDCKWIKDSLIIAKVCPTAVRVRIMKNINLEEDLRELKPCRFKFVEIEYRCGSGPAIPIEIPKSHYIAGNEILSKAYILRYLEHRFPMYSNWEFDENNYSVCIMDSNFNTFLIKSDQYILLEEEGYKVK